MTAHELMNRLGQVIGLDVSLNDDNVCRIFFDDDAVDFEAAGDILAFIGEVGPLPPDHREVFYKYLLAANFLGQETGRATLGLDTNQNSICLHQFLELPMDYEQFEVRLESFLTILRAWKSKIKENSFSDGGMDTSESDLSMNRAVIRV